MSIFKNRVALITGASGEIGKKLAIELNKKGASIILAGRSREAVSYTHLTLPTILLV